MNLQRRFPRVPSNLSGEVVMRGTKPSARPSVCACSLRDVSPEGIGLTVGDPSCALRAGDPLTIRFRVSGRELEIPGKVVYSLAHTTERCLGVKLHLELAASLTRQTYARWIVSLISGLTGTRTLGGGPG